MDKLIICRKDSQARFKTKQKKGDAFASPFPILVQIALLLNFPDVVSLEKLLE